MTLKAHEFDRIANKLQLKVRKSGDRLAWFEYGGRPVTHTKRSNKKGADLPFSHAIRQQLQLNEDQFRDLKKCPLDRQGYIQILRAKGLIAPDETEDP